jgi:acetylglutamate kinase
MKSLAAIGAQKEAAFYAQLFQTRKPEQFALIVLDPRCLRKPLLEVLISNLRILADLELTPVLLIGALDDDRTSIRFQSQRLSKELEQSAIKTRKLNCASYGLIADVRKQAAAGRIVILEMTEGGGNTFGLPQLVNKLSPAKVIFLQPSGGLRRGGKRLAVIKLDEIKAGLKVDRLSPGQKKFIEISSILAAKDSNSATYVMASPLNLLQELFTTRGSGTLMRRAASITHVTAYSDLKIKPLRDSIEAAFEKPLSRDFFNRPMQHCFIESDYRAGAILTSLAGLPYLSKFWVMQVAKGEGVARDIWDEMCGEVPAFFWRSRMDNPFNEWYMRACDGMQINGDWRVFWRGLKAPEVPGAIIAAASAPHDFEYKKE